MSNVNFSSINQLVMQLINQYLAFYKYSKKQSVQDIFFSVQAMKRCTLSIPITSQSTHAQSKCKNESNRKPSDKISQPESSVSSVERRT